MGVPCVDALGVKRAGVPSAFVFGRFGLCVLEEVGEDARRAVDVRIGAEADFIPKESGRGGVNRPCVEHRGGDAGASKESVGDVGAGPKDKILEVVDQSDAGVLVDAVGCILSDSVGDSPQNRGGVARRDFIQ